MIIRLVKNNWLIFLVVLVSIPTILALFHPGFFISDDGEWMIIRLSAFYENMRAGEFPVRFISRLNNGYGYPLGNFMYPAFLYLGSLIHIVGFGFINSIKIIFGVSMVLSGVFTYLWLQNVYKKIPAFFGAMLYIYMPYHLFDMYTRGSIGEMLALCVIPFIFWQMERKKMVETSIGIALLLLSHNSLAFLFFIPLYIYAFLRSTGSLSLKTFSSAVPFIFGVLLSLFFWLPALYDLQYTIFKTVTISEWEKYFAPFSLIGVSTVVILLAALIGFVTQRNKSLDTKIVYLFFIISGISVFLALPTSAFFWEVFPSSLIQFPFRVLSLLIPTLAYIGAFLLAIQPKHKQIILGVVLTALALFSSYPYLFPKEFTQKDDMYYISNFSTTTVKDEYMPVWVKQSVPPLPEKKIAIVKGMGSIGEETRKGNTLLFTADMQTRGVVQIQTIYFPGWKVWVDTKEQIVSYTNPHGLLEVLVPSGKHTIIVQFTETPIRLFADIVSLLTLGILILIFFVKVRYNAIKLY